MIPFYIIEFWSPVMRTRGAEERSERKGGKGG